MARFPRVDRRFRLRDETPHIDVLIVRATMGKLILVPSIRPTRTEEIGGSMLASFTERLENRRFLSVSLQGQQLLVTGTSKADDIQVAYCTEHPNRLEVRLNGVYFGYEAKDVARIRVEGHSGADRIVLDDKIAMPTELWGDGGNDYIVAGMGPDTIFAGGGNDQVFAGNGDDIVHAQTGNDTVYGSAGRDLLSGDEGNDKLYGEFDQDTLMGDAGNDYLLGGRNGDLVCGGAGDDQMFGGTGRDRFDSADNPLEHKDQGETEPDVVVVL